MRVLVAYGSTHGGTEGLARMVAESFVAREVPADIGPAASIEDLSPYDVVIVGGALHNGRWHRDAMDFVQDCADELRARPVWLFSSGPLDDSARSGGLAPVEGVRRVANALDVNGHMTFGGRLREQDITVVDAMRGRRPCDHRDPAQVDEWVRRILTRLATLPLVRAEDVAWSAGDQS